MAVRLATPHIPEDTPRVADGRYALLRRLGEGGMAVVYGAWDQDLQIWRAVKVLLPEFARRASVRRRFEREARTMMAIRHPHLVRVHEVRSERVLPYLVMDLVPGGSLEEWMLRYGPMPPRLAAAVGVEIAEGLIAVHEAGVVHRDVKPQNVLIDEDGLCRVTDFGVARVEGGDTRTGVSMGTLGYMAPEQFADSKTADARSDLYSLGATLFVLLTRRPVQEVMRLVDLPDGLAGLPGPLRPVLERCLAYERDERYPDGAALLADLIEARDALPPLGPEVPPLARTSTDNGLPGGSAGELTELQGLLDATHPPDEPDELASLVAPARSAVVQVEATVLSEPAPPRGGTDRRVWPAAVGLFASALAAFLGVLTVAAIGTPLALSTGRASVLDAERAAHEARQVLRERTATPGQLVDDLQRVGGPTLAVGEDPIALARAVASDARGRVLERRDDPDQEVARQRLQRVVWAVDHLDDAEGRWAAAAADPLGRLAIGAGLASGPD